MTDIADRIQECDYGVDPLALYAGQEVDPTTTGLTDDILYDLDSALNGA